jgi:hypothetical protein
MEAYESVLVWGLEGYPWGSTHTTEQLVLQVEGNITVLLNHTEDLYSRRMLGYIYPNPALS